MKKEGKPNESGGRRVVKKTAQGRESKTREATTRNFMVTPQSPRHKEHTLEYHE